MLTVLCGLEQNLQKLYRFEQFALYLMNVLCSVTTKIVCALAREVAPALMDFCHIRIYNIQYKKKLFSVDTFPYFPSQKFRMF